MRKLVTILLCSVLIFESVFPQLELAELVRLPELLDHFNKHRSESPEITFFEFIYLHYGNDQHFSQDSDAHQKLPFSKARHFNNLFQAIQQTFFLDGLGGGRLLMTIEGVWYCENNVDLISLTIWQPPKI